MVSWVGKLGRGKRILKLFEKIYIYDIDWYRYLFNFEILLNYNWNKWLVEWKIC